MRIRKKIPILLIFCVVPLLAGPAEDMFRSFEKQPEYVRPFATILGSLTNSGWYQSASVEKEFGFGVSLPISVLYLNTKDREYSGSYIDEGCKECKEQNAVCNGCVECQDYIAPTVFGTRQAPIITSSLLDWATHDWVASETVFPLLNDGIEDLSKLSGLPFVTLQGSFSAYYTALTLRYIGLPGLPGASINLPGIGIQHDFQHLFPSLPVSLSLAANFTFLLVSVSPGEWTDNSLMSGKLHLNGLSNFLGILAGYKPAKFIELFLETGWEHSFLKPSGTLIVKNEQITPNVTLTGRNGFRAALNVAFPLTFHPVIGGIGGAQFGYLANIISFKSRQKE